MQGSAAAPVTLAWDGPPPVAGPQDAWSRANAAEILPAPLTPLTWSLTAEPLDAAFAAMVHDPAATRGRRFVTLASGYVYFNFGALTHLTLERIGFPAQDLLQAIGGPVAGPAGGDRASARLRPLARLRHLPYAWRSMRRMRRLPEAWPAQQRHVRALHDELAALPLDTLGDGDLLDALERSGERLRDFLTFVMAAQGAAFGAYALLALLLERFLGERTLAPALVQGLPGVITAEANAALWRLAARAARDEATRRVVQESEPARLLAALRTDGRTRWLADDLAAYLVGYGHRAAGELELRQPRWIEDPGPLLLGEGACAPRSAPPATATVLRGLAASPGRAEGRARIARSAEEAAGIAPGEVLVAPFTDPGWTPAFPLAAALVVEIGGILSHGAVVAREYGLPAVMNVAGALTRIPAGARLRVDGGSGVVEILADAPSAAPGASPPALHAANAPITPAIPAPGRLEAAPPAPRRSGMPPSRTTMPAASARHGRESR